MAARKPVKADATVKRRAALHGDVGPRLRAERERREVSLRALAREVGISPSALSQIETGRSRPSVSTLYAIVSELGMSLDELFRQPTEPTGQSGGSAPATTDREQASAEENGKPAGAADDRERGPVQQEGLRTVIDLDSGVRWERLTAESDPEVDFLFVTYDVGGASSKDRAFMRHAGREYGLVLSGRLKVTTGFEPHELGPGDSISFDSSTPHLLENVGDEPVTAVWVVVGRHGDPRSQQLDAANTPADGS